MKIAIASDHAGFEFKEKIKQYLLAVSVRRIHTCRVV